MVRDYTSYMSAGDCEAAMELCTGEAKMVVQGAIDSGCQPYNTKIDSVVCTVKNEKAECYCYEYRTEYGAMPFPYQLIKEHGYWKLTTTAKDSEELGEKNL